MSGKKTHYLSYLLRLWETSNDGEQIWRASLESPGSGKRRGFADLAELIDFLYQQTTQANPTLEGTQHHEQKREKRKKF